MKKWKIVYQKNGSRLVAKVEAKTEQDARLLFYLSTQCDDILEISES